MRLNCMGPLICEIFTINILENLKKKTHGQGAQGSVRVGVIFVPGADPRRGGGHRAAGPETPFARRVPATPERAPPAHNARQRTMPASPLAQARWQRESVW